MALDWIVCPEVTRSADVMNGAWVLKGTRAPVSGIFANLEAGVAMEEIPEIYEGVTVAQVRKILRFAERSLEDLPVAI